MADSTYVDSAIDILAQPVVETSSQSFKKKRVRGTRREPSELQKRFIFDKCVRARQNQATIEKFRSDEQRLVDLWSTVRSNSSLARERADHEGHIACFPCIEQCRTCSMPVLQSMLSEHMDEHQHELEHLASTSEVVVVTADILQTMAKDLEALQQHQLQESEREKAGEQFRRARTGYLEEEQDEEGKEEVTSPVGLVVKRRLDHQAHFQCFPCRMKCPYCDMAIFLPGYDFHVKSCREKTAAVEKAHSKDCSQLIAQNMQYPRSAAALTAFRSTNQGKEEAKRKQRAQKQWHKVKEVAQESRVQEIMSQIPQSKTSKPLARVLANREFVPDDVKTKSNLEEVNAVKELCEKVPQVMEWQKVKLGISTIAAFGDHSDHYGCVKKDGGHCSKKCEICELPILLAGFESHVAQCKRISKKREQRNNVKKDMREAVKQQYPISHKLLEESRSKGGQRDSAEVQRLMLHRELFLEQRASTSFRPNPFVSRAMVQAKCPGTFTPGTPGMTKGTPGLTERLLLSPATRDQVVDLTETERVGGVGKGLGYEEITQKKLIEMGMTAKGDIEGALSEINRLEKGQNPEQQEDKNEAGGTKTDAQLLRELRRKRWERAWYASKPFKHNNYVKDVHAEHYTCDPCTKMCGVCEAPVLVPGYEYHRRACAERHGRVLPEVKMELEELEERAKHERENKLKVEEAREKRRPKDEEAVALCNAGLGLCMLGDHDGAHELFQSALRIRRTVCMGTRSKRPDAGVVECLTYMYENLEKKGEMEMAQSYRHLAQQISDELQFGVGPKGNDHSQDELRGGVVEVARGLQRKEQSQKQRDEHDTVQEKASASRWGSVRMMQAEKHHYNRSLALQGPEPVGTGSVSASTSSRGGWISRFQKDQAAQEGGVPRESNQMGDIEGNAHGKLMWAASLHNQPLPEVEFSLSENDPHHQDLDISQIEKENRFRREELHPSHPRSLARSKAKGDRAKLFSTQQPHALRGSSRWDWEAVMKQRNEVTDDFSQKKADGNKITTAEHGQAAAFGAVARINTSRDSSARESVAATICVESGQTRMGQEKACPPHTKLFDDRMIAADRSEFRCFPACECGRCKQLVLSQRKKSGHSSKKCREEESDIMKAKAKEFAYKVTMKRASFL